MRSKSPDLEPTCFIFATKKALAAGHNADDIAETVLLNILRGDVPRLGRCASIITGAPGCQNLTSISRFMMIVLVIVVMFQHLGAVFAAG